MTFISRIDPHHEHIRLIFGRRSSGGSSAQGGTHLKKLAAG
jgi:hypothetical protein